LVPMHGSAMMWAISHKLLEGGDYRGKFAGGNPEYGRL
jgi:hypothetical protein